MYRLCLLLGLLSLVFAQDKASLVYRENRVALIIGNKTYKNSPLQNTENDAKDMAQALKKLNFDVDIVLNGNRRQIKEAIRKFGNKLNENSVSLFYYSGHGMQMEGNNYLVPIDAKIQKEYDVEYECVSANYALEVMKKSKLSIVILDACRNNPFSVDKSMRQGLAPMQTKGNMLLCYATAKGKVASDRSSNGRNGLFTEALLKFIEQPGLELFELIRKVAKRVKQKSNGTQIPWYESNITEAWYMNPISIPPIIVPPVPPIAPKAVLLLKFDDITKSGVESVSEIENSGSSKQYVEIVGKIDIDKNTKKVGTSSAYFNGKSYLKISDSKDWYFGSEDFTIDFWIKRKEKNIYHPVIGQHTGVRNGNPRNVVDIYPSGKLWFYQYGDINSEIHTVTTKKINDFNWHHVIIIKKSDTLQFYIDDVLCGEVHPCPPLKNNPNSLYIGYSRTSSEGIVYFKGWLDELHIHKGIATRNCGK